MLIFSGRGVCIITCESPSAVTSFIPDPRNMMVFNFGSFCMRQITLAHMLSFSIGSSVCSSDTVIVCNCVALLMRKVDKSCIDSNVTLHLCIVRLSILQMGYLCVNASIDDNLRWRVHNSSFCRRVCIPPWSFVFVSFTSFILMMIV